MGPRLAVPTCAVAFLLAAGAEGQPVAYRVPRAAGAPVVDGALDDACWRQALAISAFRPLGRGADQPAPPATTAMLAYDDDALYVAYRCAEPLADSLKLKVRDHDGPTWGDDCVEMFFDPSGERISYVQIVVNAAGVVMDASYTGQSVGMDASYESETQAATRVGQGEWTLEARIPFFALPPARLGRPWVFHLARTRAAAGQLLTSLQSSVSGYHEIAKFDTLEGISLPDRPVEVVSSSIGDLLRGRNLGRASVRNRSDRRVAVELSAGLADGQPPARGVATAEIEPGKTAEIIAPWHLDETGLGRRATLEARSSGVLLHRRSAAVKGLPEHFGRLSRNAWIMNDLQPVRIETPVNLAEGSRPNVELHWQAAADGGEVVASGQTVVRDRVAVIRLYWSRWTGGAYTLSLDLIQEGRSLARMQQPIRLVEGPWGDD